MKKRELVLGVAIFLLIVGVSLIVLSLRPQQSADNSEFNYDTSDNPEFNYDNTSLESQQNNFLEDTMPPKEQEIVADSSTNTQCQKIGCYSNSLFAGYKETYIYYDCSCPQVSQISKENLICFSSDSDAIYRGYNKAYNCGEPTF